MLWACLLEVAAVLSLPLETFKPDGQFNEEQKWGEVSDGC